MSDTKYFIEDANFTEAWRGNAWVAYGDESEFDITQYDTVEEAEFVASTLGREYEILEVFWEKS